MKKLLFLLLIVIQPVLINAQIRRIIDGVTLDQTTKQEVIMMFKNRHKAFQIQDNGQTVRSSERVKFAGITWDEVCYVFINEKVWKIVYLKSGRQKYNEVLSDGSYLKQNLFNKYRSYYIPNSDVDFSDGKTHIFFFFNLSENAPGLSLQYYTEVSLPQDYDDL